jgi:hypothetical protein
MKRLVVVSMLVAAVVAPAALATTIVPKVITVASSSAVTPSDAITVTKKFSPVPRSITIVTSGPVNDVRVRTSACYRKNGEDVISTARDDRPGRLAVGYDHTTARCTIIATAEASSARPGRTIKIAIQIER